MKLTNNEIYTKAENLLEAFQDKEQRLPIKISFFIQKNKKTLLDLAQDIEKSRMEIISTYGREDPESQQFIIEPEKIDETQKELNDLFSLTQEVNISMIQLDDLQDDLNLTNKQMEAIMFMIKE